MKRVLCSVAVLLMASPVFADRIQQLTQDVVLQSALDGVERKYGVECELPTSDREVNWRCLNGPTCGYSYNVVCPFPGPLPRVVHVKVHGRTTRVRSANSNTITSLEFQRVE